MTKFADTPQWKRELVWSPRAGQMVKPATDDQVALVYKLSQEIGLEICEPVGRDEARKQIGQLIRKRRQRANKYGVA